MGAVSFQQKATFRLDGRTYTLLQMFEENRWQMQEHKTGYLKEMTISELRGAYVEGKLSFIPAASAATPNPERQASQRVATAVDPKLLEEAKIKRLYVKAALELPLTKSVLVPEIEELWGRLGKPLKAPDFVTVCRWVTRYIAGGRDVHALIDNASGTQGNREARFPKALLDILEETIETKYLTLERYSIQETLDAAQGAVLKENRIRPASEALPMPTRRMIRRLIGELDAFDVCSARYGRNTALKKFRGVLYKNYVPGPLVRAEIDHTRLDLMVVDAETFLPLGRPWLTVCIDSYTRCVLGFWLGFDPPSLLTVARCLRHAVMPKDGLKAEYPSIKSDWEAHGIMRTLVVDQALEFHSQGLENACYSFGTDIIYSPRKTPWFKGKVERFLGTLNRAVHGVPGTTFSNIIEKDEYDPVKHATVTLKTLQEVLRKWIADVYHQKTHRALGTSPAATWKAGIHAHDIEVPDDPLALDAVLGKIEPRKLTHKGIEVHGLHYNSRELIDLRMRLGQKLDVDVSIDDGCIDHVVVLSPDKTHMVKVPCLEMDYVRGMSAWQHKVCKRFAAQNLPKAAGVEAWLQAKLDIQDLIAQDVLRKKRKTRVKQQRYVGNQPLPGAVAPDAQALAAEPTPPSPKPALPLPPADPKLPAAKPPRRRYTAIVDSRLPGSSLADSDNAACAAKEPA